MPDDLFNPRREYPLSSSPQITGMISFGFFTNGGVVGRSSPLLLTHALAVENVVQEFGYGLKLTSLWMKDCQPYSSLCPRPLT